MPVSSAHPPHDAHVPIPILVVEEAVRARLNEWDEQILNARVADDNDGTEELDALQVDRAGFFAKES